VTIAAKLGDDRRTGLNRNDWAPNASIQYSSDTSLREIGGLAAVPSPGSGPFLSGSRYAACAPNLAHALTFYAAQTQGIHW
jgi:hypothetical protein